MNMMYHRYTDDSCSKFWLIVYLVCLKAHFKGSLFETIEFEISSGTLPSGANHMLFRSGATYVIDVVSGSFGSNGLIMTINGITNINLVNGRNRYTYNGGTTAGVVFKFSNDLSVIEIEVKEYQ